jgi:sulfite reductase beta subunit-like hemoprotein
MTGQIEPRQEVIKREKDGLDVWEDFSRYAKLGHAAISDGDYERFKWYGLYQQRPRGSGHFMLRIRIPGGRLTIPQLRGIGELSRRWGRNTAAITTRQNIQIYWVQIRDVPELFKVLHHRLGLDQRFAAGDTPRNITGCPLDGAQGDESVDCRAIVDLVSAGFGRAGKEYSNLPRKLKISIGSCPLHCHLPQINDIGFFGTARRRGHRTERGLGVVVGGGLSSTPHLAQSLRVFVPPRPDMVWDICRVVTAMFRDCAHLRRNRQRARLKFHVDEAGWRAFRGELQDRLGYSLEDEDGGVLPASASLGDHLGVHEQRDGRFYLGLPVRQGRLSGDDLVRLAGLIERSVPESGVFAATTTRQNLVVRDVSRQRVDELASALGEAGFRASESGPAVRVVSCTGREYCNFGLAETKSRAEAIQSHLQDGRVLPHPLLVSVAGCPNCCAQCHIADIGLQGARVHTTPGQEGFHICVGGRLGEDPAFGRFVTDREGRRRELPADTVHLAIEVLVNAYADSALPGEPFHAWIGRQPMQAIDDLLVAASCRTNVVPGG